VKRAPAEDIVAFMSFSDQSDEAVSAIQKFTPRDWNRVVQWMDDAGLSLYFQKRLIEASATQIVPMSVSSHLQRSIALNQARVDDMLGRFRSINQQFDNARVRYAVVKGFSLIPEFCPEAVLRHQADIDYLIDQQSVPAARRVLVDAGYVTQASVSAKESIFVSPGATPSRGDSQYSATAGHAVELHTDVWDSDMHGIQCIPKFLGVSQARPHYSNGLAFPALPDVDAFLLQVLHACRHLFTQWIRMSCLFEIGYFLNRRAGDTALWCAVEQRLQGNALLREFVVIVSELVVQLFAPPLPPLIQDWAEEICPASRVWIDHYARRWAFCELPVHQLSLSPRSKLVLFLQEQYRSESSRRNRAQKPDLSSAALPVKKKPVLLVSDWRKRKHLLRRGVYYALAQARYLCEIPRWRYLNRRTASRRASQPLQASKRAS